ncbi:uncharacterized protein LOC143021290 [Oratosquilla oratoria]|uniref:uncharacterized protein LOC143021290 n=1 Tax=Oratosquilla oratoria TaxID=337810 RepID=UPI003F75C9DF
MSSNHSIDEGPVSGRVRVLTAEGQEAFQRASDQHEERVKASREGVQALLEEPNHGPWLYEAHAVYQDTVKRYLEFLMRERTPESLARAESVKHEDRDFQASFRQVISNYASSSSVEVTEEEHHTEPFLQDDPKSNQVPLSLVDHSERCMPPSMKGSSRRSVRSGRSSSTSVSVARKQRAKVETARISQVCRTGGSAYERAG